MISNKRQFRNQLHIDKKSIEFGLIRNENTIKQLKNSDLNIEFCTTKIEKIKIDTIEKNIKLEILTREISELECGLLDIRISDKIIKNKHESDVRENKALITKIQKKEENDRKKEISEEYWNKIKENNHIQSQKKRDIRYAYKLYNKAIETLPEYMLKNLNEMPNNKGYIWRSCQFFGKLKEQNNQPVILFEKSGKNILLIHEITQSEHKIFKKEGKNRKILDSTTIRKQKKQEASLFDYIK